MRRAPHWDDGVGLPLGDQAVHSPHMYWQVFLSDTLVLVSKAVGCPLNKAHRHHQTLYETWCPNTDSDDPPEATA
jgi:hypothetical protein